MSRSLMGRICGTAAALLMAGPALAQPAQQRMDAELQRATQLVPHEAAALVTTTMLGHALPDALAEELLRFFRDAESSGQSANVTDFAEDLTRFLTGVLASGGPRAVDPAMLDLPALPGGPGDGGLPDLEALYAAYGLANTLAYITAAVAVPDLGPWVLPHNIRVVADYVNVQNASETQGDAFVPFVTQNVAVGQSFTLVNTTLTDTLIGTALDQHTVSDLILIQVPLSLEIAVTTTCTRTGRQFGFFGPIVCNRFDLDTSTTVNDAVVATNPTYTVAYPLNAGTFATRVEATDLFQVVYDALGNLNTQKPRELTAASPFARVPGLEVLADGTGAADLATQAPPVNFYGAQVAEGTLGDAVASGVINPLLSALTDETLDVRTVPATSTETGLLGGLLSLSLTPAPLDPRIGITAGYRAEEVRAGDINLMVLRWHSVGTETLGSALDNTLSSLMLGQFLPSMAEALMSAPASIYYDVPEGEYMLGADRVDGRDAVFATDFAFAAAPPELSVPPRLPNGADLEALAAQIQALLGGELPDVPGLPATD